jgi:molecular chaperone DnaK
MAVDNKTLGRFDLIGIPPAPRGIPQIEVTFDIDANGILSVKAKDKGTGKEQSITITGASTLPKDEVDRLVKEAEVNSDQDKQKRSQIEIKNQADSLCYQSERQLKDLEGKIDEKDKENVEKQIQYLRQVLNGTDYKLIEDEQKKLQDLLMSLGQKVYSSTNETNNNESTKDSVIDTDSKDA